ncbi:MAG: hypothetical protein JXR95_03785 [Deltaproteobacteria bacterium]|nr:hypothetical protein [Deltaproteobacteria bacterium]
MISIHILLSLIINSQTTDSEIFNRQWEINEKSGLVSVDYKSTETVNTALARDSFLDKRVRFNKSCQKISMDGYTVFTKKRVPSPSQAINTVTPYGYEKIPGGTQLREKILSLVGAADYSQTFTHYRLRDTSVCRQVFEKIIPLRYPRPVKEIKITISGNLSVQTIWMPSQCTLSKSGTSTVITCKSLPALGYRNLLGRKVSMSQAKMRKLPRVIISAWNQKKLLEHLKNMENATLAKIHKSMTVGLQAKLEEAVTVTEKINTIYKWTTSNFRHLPELDYPRSIKNIIATKSCDHTEKALLIAALIRNHIPELKNISLIHASDTPTVPNRIFSMNTYSRKNILIENGASKLILDISKGSLSSCGLTGGKYISVSRLKPHTYADISGIKRILKMKGVLKKDKISFRGTYYFSGTTSDCSVPLKKLNIKTSECNFIEKSSSYSLISFRASQSFSGLYTEINGLTSIGGDIKPGVDKNYNIAYTLKKTNLDVSVEIDLGNRKLFSLILPEQTFKPRSNKLNGAVYGKTFSYTYSFGNGIVKMRARYFTKYTDVLPEHFGIKNSMSIKTLGQEIRNFGNMGIVINKQ